MSGGIQDTILGFFGVPPKTRQSFNEADAILSKGRSEILNKSRSYTSVTKRHSLTMAIKKRLSAIRIRNKQRRILVVYDINIPEDKNALTDALLASNPSATSTVMSYADEPKEVLNTIETRAYDMIYAVVDMGNNNRHGPCLFSMDHVDDEESRLAREEDHYKLVNVLKEHRHPMTELIVVCGSSSKLCPIAGKLEEIRDQSFEV